MELKTKTELLIFTRIGQVQAGLLIITIVVTFMVGIKDQLMHDLYQTIITMVGLTFLLLAILLNLIKIKWLKLFIVIFISFIALYHLWLYLLNALQIKHAPILNNLFSLQSEILNFLVFAYAIFCFINLLWIINKTNLSKRHLIIMDYFYFGLGLCALFIKYFGSKTLIATYLDITAFIIGAIAVALRFAKINGELILNNQS